MRAWHAPIACALSTSNVRAGWRGSKGVLLFAWGGAHCDEQCEGRKRGDTGVAWRGGSDPREGMTGR